MLILMGMIALMMTACSDKGTNNDEGDDTPTGPGPALILKINREDPDVPNTTIPVPDAIVEVYQSIMDWNMDQAAVFSGVTGTDGKLVIYNDTLTNRGISDQTNFYLFVHEPVETLSNWSTVGSCSAGVVDFDKRDSL